VVLEKFTTKVIGVQFGYNAENVMPKDHGLILMMDIMKMMQLIDGIIENVQKQL